MRSLTHNRRTSARMLLSAQFSSSSLPKPLRWPRSKDVWLGHHCHSSNIDFEIPVHAPLPVPHQIQAIHLSHTQKHRIDVLLGPHQPACTIFPPLSFPPWFTRRNYLQQPVHRLKRYPLQGLHQPQKATW